MTDLIISALAVVGAICLVCGVIVMALAAAVASGERRRETVQRLRRAWEEGR